MEKLKTLNGDKLQKYLNLLDNDELLSLRNACDDLYYNTGESVVSDENYDILIDVMKNKGIYSLKVGAKLREGENRVELPYWLGSADKITDKDSAILTRWLKDNKAKRYLISEKLDGVSCLLVSKNGKIKLYTRGDGVIGADISYLAQYIPSIPKRLDDIAVRGELIIPKDVFNKKYRNKEVNGRVYKNARNMVSGLIGSKTARKGIEDIVFNTYEIVGDTMPKPSRQLKTLSDNNFTVVKHVLVPELNIEILKNTLLNFKEESEYEIDGIIIQSDMEYDRNIDGNPDYLFAFKMLLSENIHETKVKEIEWNTSRWGQLKPVAIVEPVDLGDVTINRATAHNAKYVMDNNLGKGSIIKITRSKDVIPYIVDVVKGTKPDMPEVDFVWDKNHVNITVKQFQNTMCIKVMSNFFNKLGIKFISEATVEKLYDAGIDNLYKIISAKKSDFLKVPQFGDKSAERIYTNIHNGLQNVKIHNLLGASGVFGFGIGERKLDSLFLAIPDLLSYYKKYDTEEIVKKIVKVEGFSEITATKIALNLKYADMFIKKIKPYITLTQIEKVDNNLDGVKVVMSGFRDKTLQEDIIKRGGKVMSSVSKNTNILIVSTLSQKLTGKSAKAEELGVKILSKDQFISKYIK